MNRKEILEGLSREIRGLEKLNSTKRAWLNDNRKAMQEFEEIVQNFKNEWLRLDKLLANNNRSDGGGG